MRKPHYWKPAGRTTAPSEIVVFDVETWHGEEAKVSGGEIQKFRLACGLAYRYEKGKRTRLQKLFTTRKEEVWPFIVSRLRKNRPVWLFAHNTPFDVGAAGLWKYIIGPHASVGKCVLTATTTWLDLTVDGSKLVVSDTANYLKMPLSKIGEAVGLAKMPMPDQDEDDESWFRYCMNDVEVTALAVDRLIDFVRQEDLGRWQPTAAGMAFQALRKKFYPPRVLVHCDWDVLAMEREAYYGGIVETAFVGRTDLGPITECDVTSMYPSVCLRDLPIRLSHSFGSMGVSALSRKLSSRMGIASVQINSKANVYPVRRNGKVFHANGRFRTCLPHPELELALKRGDIECVHGVSLYEPEPLFRGYMDYFFRKRITYTDLKNHAFAEFAKLLMNSLYGKMGQRSPRWMEWSETALQIVEADYGLARGTLADWYDWPPESDCHEWIHVWPEHQLSVNLRQYWGCVEVDCGYSESRDSCPAIAATVTSYARCVLRDYQAIAGTRDWVYSDTDSVWVTCKGLARLRESGAVRPGSIGFLDEKGQYDWVIIHGPKDYETPLCSSLGMDWETISAEMGWAKPPTSTKIKGVKKNATKGEKKMFSQLQFPSAMQQLKNPCPDGIFVRRVEKDLRRVIDRCIVGPDGWTRPITLEE